MTAFELCEELHKYPCNKPVVIRIANSVDRYLQIVAVTQTSHRGIEILELIVTEHDEVPFPGRREDRYSQ